MEAGKRTINDIFNGNRVLEIPFFQRSYVWEEKQWQRFLDDMESISDLNKPYFLGSIILKQQHTSSNQINGDIRTLIDGQQRLTTLCIFFKVFCLKCGNSIQFDRIFRLMDQKIALLHNYIDIESFNKVLDLTTEEKVDSNNNVIAAYDFFRTNIDKSKLDISKILNNVMFVGIDLGPNEDEQQIFDTINSLGVSLTTAELLKNFFFHRNDETSFRNYWRDVFEKDTETKNFWDLKVNAAGRDNIDLFFYSFLQIKIQDPVYNVKAEDKKIFGKVEGLFNSYKDFISLHKVDKAELLQEIKKYAELYRANFDLEIMDKEISESFGKERINLVIFGLENTTLIPYVLYILKNVKDENEQNSIFQYLETYIVRRMICHESTKNYSALFSERLISNKVSKLEDLRKYIEKQSDRVNFMPSDDDLKKGFDESKLINKQAAGILYLLESKIRDRSKHSTTLLGLGRYSLEHVMPKKWENHWGKLQTETEKNHRNRKLLTLGNLTIISTSLNSAIRDADWNTKKNGKGDKHGLIHFASGIDTFAAFLNLSDWNEEVIEKRAEYLYEKAKDIWAISEIVKPEEEPVCAV